MNSTEYLKNLLNLYDAVKPLGLVKLSYISPDMIMLDSKNKKLQCTNLLGFHLRNCSWLGNKLAIKNSDIIRKVLNNPENLLISVDLTGGNKIIIKMFNKFGKIWRKYKIKPLSINFGFKQNLIKSNK